MKVMGFVFLITASGKEAVSGKTKAWAGGIHTVDTCTALEQVTWH